VAATRRSEPAVLDVRSSDDWEAWLARNHDAVPEGVWLRLFKKDRPEATLTYSAALDVALCFGWIDGQVRKHDDVSRVQRFTPRRPRSGWSKLNTQRAERLIAAGRMRPSGQNEVDAAKEDGRWQAAYDSPSTAEVPDDFLAALRRNEKAAAFFATLDRRNLYPIVYRLQTAKKPETRAKRIDAIIDMLERGEKFHE
jgi:uncharacterized protein YdeI (YjbR/CyaY-like superfamily)